ncbi:DUF2935 domain-containing protein [Aminipila luticellarii]|uniref:DUF2935 domain-containing protein n=1 Tax=Aminipila luticellarii TaxID=2507160 RepID=A0A410PTB6_9FIRM|nr:DUF2935 domain-containing protein [Aminipila luticellarii]QAT42212.1 DUF2935 domain-containing protein [Aminipila luticellarii]
MPYLQNSMELNLFFLRILKEHALFMQLSFMPRDKEWANMAVDLRERLTQLLKQAVILSKGYISQEVMTSGELFTQYTEEAERQMEGFTGVPIDIQITMDEYDMGGAMIPPSSMKPYMDALNQNALALSQQLLQFMKRVLGDVDACRAITTLYPTQIDHLAREVRHYIFMLKMLLSGDMEITPQEFAGEQAFWNEIMREHAQFIDGLLDPSETGLKEQASVFAEQFANLVQQAENAEENPEILPQVTADSKDATYGIENFKSQGAQGILSCKIQSIINPLLSDHVLREANYYLRILGENAQA